MSEPSALLTAALMGAGFVLTFLFLLFLLWSSGKSPLLQRLGEMIMSMLYLAGVLTQAWNARGSETADVMRLAALFCATAAALTTFRYFKALRSGDHADGAR